MRVEIERVEKKVEFEGFKLIIDVESLSELKNLYNRFHVSSKSVNKQCNNDWCIPCSMDDIHAVVSDELIKLTEL